MYKYTDILKTNLKNIFKINNGGKIELYYLININYKKRNKISTKIYRI